ncbi:hypothetical protein [Erythrobacter rubeus]|uniref:Lipoprotein n=1 Tax=Erythrobacter rubeus TaxID=2760803 RepID=A0ABR8KTT0_9SPHN|nr:hypothetical protein [Erythrobacter rubeus]MBD2842765.1 hypothetical protein [Erythrobacter rubeus]
MMKRSITACAAFALLAACGSDDPSGEDTAANEGGEVTGNVLGGSISDDMLPLDQLTSQSPPIEPVDEAATSTTTSDDGDDDGEAESERTQAADAASNGEGGSLPVAPPQPAPPAPPAVQEEGE